MGSPGLADGGNDAFSPVQQLAHKLKANATTGTENKPCREILIGIQYIGYLIHGTLAGHRPQKDGSKSRCQQPSTLNDSQVLGLP